MGEKKKKKRMINYVQDNTCTIESVLSSHRECRRAYLL